VSLANLLAKNGSFGYKVAQPNFLVMHWMAKKKKRKWRNKGATLLHRNQPAAAQLEYV